MLKLYKSQKSFFKTFATNKSNLQNILGIFCVIEHVGSTAVREVDGKGIIDILVGFDDEAQIEEAVTTLINNGYFLGRHNAERTDRMFLASSEDDTTLGDIHLHLVIKGSKDFNDFIKIRDFLRNNPKEARKYSELKYKIAEETSNDREAYKNRKSLFLAAILNIED